MLEILSDQINACVGVYRKVNQKYFNSLIIPILLLTLFSLILGFFLESGLYYLESYVLNNKTADYDPVVTLIYSVNHLGFGVEIITLVLFVPYFWKTLNKPIEAEYSISIAMNRIPHKKWGMFITSILIFFVSGLFFQNVNPYGDFIGLNLAGYFENTSDQFYHWFASLYAVLSNLLPLVFGCILVQFDEFDMGPFKEKWRKLFISVILLLSFNLVLSGFIESFNQIVLGLFSIFSDTELFNSLVLVISNFWIQLYTIPILFCLLSGGKKISEKTNKKLDDSLIDG